MVVRRVSWIDCRKSGLLVQKGHVTSHSLQLLLGSKARFEKSYKFPSDSELFLRGHGTSSLAEVYQDLAQQYQRLWSNFLLIIKIISTHRYRSKLVDHL